MNEINELKLDKKILYGYFSLLKTCQILERQIDELNKTLEEVREQGSSAMDEASKYKKLYEEQLERNEVQKKRMKQLQQENEKLNKKVHSYYMAMVTG